METVERIGKLCWRRCGRAIHCGAWRAKARKVAADAGSISMEAADAESAAPPPWMVSEDIVDAEHNMKSDILQPL